MQVSWRGSDQIEVEIKEDRIFLKAKGCSNLLKSIKSLQNIEKARVKDVCESLGTSHWELLIKEALLKAIGEWDFPYGEEELCHCRMIATKTVDEAVVGGLHEAQEIGTYCSAGITCGNCKVDIDNIINYRISKSD